MCVPISLEPNSLPALQVYSFWSSYLQVENFSQRHQDNFQGRVFTYIARALEGLSCAGEPTTGEIRQEMELRQEQFQTDVFNWLMAEIESVDKTVGVTMKFARLALASRVLLHAQASRLAVQMESGRKLAAFSRKDVGKTFTIKGNNVCTCDSTNSPPHSFRPMLSSYRPSLIQSGQVFLNKTDDDGSNSSTVWQLGGALRRRTETLESESIDEAV